VTDRYPIERISEAFAHASAGRGLKTAITPGTHGSEQPRQTNVRRPARRHGQGARS